MTRENRAFTFTPSGVRVVDDPAELQAFYDDQPAAHIYALVDLEPPFWAHSRWLRRGDAVVGLIADLPNKLLTAYAVATRDPEATTQLLVDIIEALPAGLLITGPTGMTDAVRPHRPLRALGPHVRYARRTLDPPPADDPAVVPLGSEHLDALTTLYEHEPGAAFFLPSMVDDETFVGVWHPGGSELIAAAGTHVLSNARGVAAIGAVYVRPEHRGHGLGRRVTTGVLNRLEARAATSAGGLIETVGLNVADANTPAKSIYEGLGFEPIHVYEEIELGPPTT